MMNIRESFCVNRGFLFNTKQVIALFFQFQGFSSLTRFGESSFELTKFAHFFNWLVNSIRREMLEENVLHQRFLNDIVRIMKMGLKMTREDDDDDVPPIKRKKTRCMRPNHINHPSITSGSRIRCVALHDLPLSRK